MGNVSVSGSCQKAQFVASENSSISFVILPEKIPSPPACVPNTTQATDHLYVTLLCPRDLPQSCVIFFTNDSMSPQVHNQTNSSSLVDWEAVANTSTQTYVEPILLTAGLWTIKAVDAVNDESFGSASATMVCACIYIPRSPVFEKDRFLLSLALGGSTKDTVIGNLSPVEASPVNGSKFFPTLKIMLQQAENATIMYKVVGANSNDSAALSLYNQQTGIVLNQSSTVLVFVSKNYYNPISLQLVYIFDESLAPTSSPSASASISCSISSSSSQSLSPSSSPNAPLPEFQPSPEASFSSSPSAYGSSPGTIFTSIATQSRAPAISPTLLASTAASNTKQIVLISVVSVSLSQHSNSSCSEHDTFVQFVALGSCLLLAAAICLLVVGVVVCRMRRMRRRARVLEFEMPRLLRGATRRSTENSEEKKMGLLLKRMSNMKEVEEEEEDPQPDIYSNNFMTHETFHKARPSSKR